MADIIAPIVRVLLRYLAGICLAKGLSSQANILTDPDFVQVASFAGAIVCGSISEGWWYLARKRGWSL